MEKSDLFYIEIQTSSPDKNEIIQAMMLAYPFDSAWEDDNTVKIYYNPNIIDAEQIEAFKEIVSGFCLSFRLKREAYKNWNQEWESNFNPVEVDDYCYIYADFHPMKEGFDHAIRIAPKMAFGTGHHETTFMMMQQMRQIDMRGKKVADIGCGTGILSVLAAKKGALVYGIDNEYPAYENALEHAALNDVDVHFMHGDITELNVKPFDVVLANINRPVLTQNNVWIKDLVSDNGVLLISGVLRKDIHELDKMYHDMKLRSIHGKGDWTCFVYEKV